MIYYPQKNIKKNKQLKIIFAGTPYFAAQHLQALITAKHHIIMVITQPDRPSGRGQKTIFSPVKIVANKYLIPILQPISLDTQDVQKTLKKLNADIMLVVAYGIILPDTILNLFPLGCINIHASLLPRWRGPAPIQWAILKGDKTTGISIIKMDKGIDTGKILYSIDCPISLQDTYTSLEKKLILIGIKAILIVLEKYFLKTNIFILQNDINATYAKKIKKEQARLNWNINAKTLSQLVRAFNPWPVAFFMINNQLIKVWKADTHRNTDKEKKIGEVISANKNGIKINTINGIFNITQLQISGKKIISVHDFLNSKKEWFIPGKKID